MSGNVWKTENDYNRHVGIHKSNNYIVDGGLFMIFYLLLANATPQPN